MQGQVLAQGKGRRMREPVHRGVSGSNEFNINYLIILATPPAPGFYPNFYQLG
jgi:hypothetical protein